MSLITVVGISHVRTPAHLRERLQLTPDEAANFSRWLAPNTGEAVVLATCNRTEIYLAGADADEAREQARFAFLKYGDATLAHWRPKPRSMPSGAAAAVSSSRTRLLEMTCQR